MGQKNTEIEYKGSKYYVQKFPVRRGFEVFASCLAIFGAPLVKLLNGQERDISDPSVSDSLSDLGRNFLKDDGFGALKKLFSDVKVVRNGVFVDLDLDRDTEIDYSDIVHLAPILFKFQFESFLGDLGPLFAGLKSPIQQPQG